MGSGLDPNSDFLTKPVSVFEPIDSAILTQPAWVKVFLTPGAKFTTGTVPPAGPVASNVPTQGQGTATVALATNTLPAGTGTAVPTNTFVWIPLPATDIPGPKDTKSPPAATPIPSADLWVLMTSTTNTYSAGDILSYTVTVGNAGPNAITGAVITDNIPPAAQVTSWDWACGPVGGGASGCNGVLGSNATFTDTVNLPSGGSIAYTVTIRTSPTATGDLTNAASITAAGYTETDLLDNNDDWTHNTTTPNADLWVTKDDLSELYVAGGTTTYLVRIGNNGPSAVPNALITDAILPGQIASWNWVCIAELGGASGCEGVVGSTTNFSDTVNLPVGSEIQYRVTANIAGGASGNLTNIAILSGSAEGNNTAADPVPDVPIILSARPGQLDTKDCTIGSFIGCTFQLNTGGQITFTAIAPIVDVPGPDLVYYERPTNPTTVTMDRVIVQISDGHNWYTVYYWGDGAADTNTNVIPPIDSCTPTEDDNCEILYTSLYGPSPATGITIDINGMVGTATGPFLYIRITEPGESEGVTIDAILPP